MSFIVGFRFLRSLNCCKRSLYQQYRFRFFSTASFEAPASITEEKVYPTKLIEIVDKIEKLNLLEVSELNSLLRKRLNLPNVPMSFSPSAIPASAEETETEPKPVKSFYTVKLNKFEESKKVMLIKEIKSIVEGMNLVQAKKFVESCPQVIKADVSKDEAEQIKSKLEVLGGHIEIE